MDLNKGVPTLFAYCERLIWKIFFKFKQGTCPSMAFAWIFFGIFMIFVGGSVGQIIYREYTVFRGSNISCSLACMFCPTVVGQCVEWSGASNRQATAVVTEFSRWNAAGTNLKTTVSFLPRRFSKALVIFCGCSLCPLACRY